MALKRELREEIKRYILRHIRDNDGSVAAKTMDAYGISRTSVANYIRQLQNERIIIPCSNSKSKYILKTETKLFTYAVAESLEEDRIFKKDIAPLLQAFPKNVFETWRYCFTEMMNNAIEHANATQIRVLVNISYLDTAIAILDDGIGIFQKIQAYFSEQEHEEITLDEAVAILFPGKFTTDSENHTGEGIFFSSRAVDEFFIQSDGKIFAHDPFDDILFDAPLVSKQMDKGTIVLMRLENLSKRELAETMNLFSDVENGFFKTQLPLAHIFQNNAPVSRSEARRLGAMIARFEDVTLDFKGIEGVGQGFVHELFVVFARNHPEIRFHRVNVSQAVESMILRVLNTK